MSTRDTILHTIKAQPKANVEELAVAAEVSPVTVRHHLNSLQAEGLIFSESVRRSVGRPYYVYSLSEKGQELFPKRYVRLTARLLDELKTHLPEEMVQGVLSNVVNGMVDEHRGKFEHLAFEERLDFLVKLLEEEGFLASWEATQDGYRLTEYSCPYVALGESHAEICTIDTELIVNVLDTQVTQNSCMLDGGQCCEFLITVKEPAEELAGARRETA
jgi:DeoR family suf operon transcriptional repressor